MGNNQSFGNLIEVGDVILHSDILTEYFCCDIERCHGRCCEEGDAGAPVTLDVREDGATLTFDIPGEQREIYPREIIFQDAEFAECLNIQPSKDTILVKLYWRLAKAELLESSLAELDSVLQTVCTESNRFELTYWDYTIAEASSYPGTRRGAFLYQRMESICPNSCVTKMTINNNNFFPISAFYHKPFTKPPQTDSLTVASC